MDDGYRSALCVDGPFHGRWLRIRDTATTCDLIYEPPIMDPSTPEERRLYTYWVAAADWAPYFLDAAPAYLVPPHVGVFQVSVPVVEHPDSELWVEEIVGDYTALHPLLRGTQTRRIRDEHPDLEVPYLDTRTRSFTAVVRWLAARS